MCVDGGPLNVLAWVDLQREPCELGPGAELEPRVYRHPPAGPRKHLQVLDVGEHELEVLGADVRLRRESADLRSELRHEAVEGTAHLLRLEGPGGLGP